MNLALNTSQMSHLRLLVDDRMRILETKSIPSPELMSSDVEYQQLMEIDQILSHLLEEEEEGE